MNALLNFDWVCEEVSVNGKVLLKTENTPDLSAYDEKQQGINPDFVIENISKENVTNFLYLCVSNRVFSFSLF